MICDLLDSSIGECARLVTMHWTCKTCHKEWTLPVELTPEECPFCQATTGMTGYSNVMQPGEPES
jgi:rubrerythrin